MRFWCATELLNLPPKEHESASALVAQNVVATAIKPSLFVRIMPESSRKAAGGRLPGLVGQASLLSGAIVSRARNSRAGW